jgi:uncharacterized protein (TIGR00369 family)
VTDAHTLNRDPLPFARLLEIEFREAGRDRIVAEMTVRSDLCTAGGRVHGGALMALADNTAAMGTAISLPDGAMGTTTIRQTSSAAPRSEQSSSRLLCRSIVAGKRRCGRPASRPRTADSSPS